MNIVRIEPGVFSVLRDGKSYTVVIDGDTALVNGTRVPLPADPRDWRPGSSGAGAGGAENIVAPMPGRVVKVLVSAGETVEAGAGIVVVEAMKMQNEMQAARGGRVSSLRVREGDTVCAGDVLASIE
jgi:biotin carboxyl carrier protein